MAVSLSKTRSEQLLLHKNRNQQDEEDMDNNNNNNSNVIEQKRALVPVVYYLSRNGQLEHPHFMEVPLSSPQGLYLRDVIHRLNLLRGKSMAFHYSWSSKRSYKSGYVWHDLGENDYIHPVHGGEYVLKGSEILETTSLSSPSLSKSPETSSSSSSGMTNNVVPPAASNRRRNQSWGAIDLHEYKVYKSESTHEFAAADASTQTDDKRRRRKAVIKEEPEIEAEEKSMELSRGEISPPPSDSSPETLESLMKADGRLVINNNNNNNSGNAVSSLSSTSQAIDQVVGGVDQTAGYCPNGGRMKASSVLMSLISCGSISFRDCGATAVKDHGLSLISHYKPRSTRGGNTTVDDDNGDGINNDNDDIMMKKQKNVGSSSFAKMALEDKEYFSGSLIETNKNNYKEDPQFISLKRSSSYNEDRSSHLKLDRKEVDGVRAKCIPRRPKAQANNNKERVSETSSIATNSTQNGSQN